MPEMETFFADTLIADTGLVDFLAPSPNIGERPKDKSLDIIVLHYTGMKTAQGALDWLCREEAQVSCHYFVFEDGRIAQLVAEKYRAWHAGKSYWHGETDINSRSIGIEIANPGHEFGYVDFPDAQMKSVVALVSDIFLRRKIPAANILAHSDIAPMRKEDPGERFDWKMLHDAGLGNWFEPHPICKGDVLQLGDVGSKVADYRTMLRRYGFEIEADEKFDTFTQVCTTAFQRRYRQQCVDGIADISTIETLRKLLA